MLQMTLGNNPLGAALLCVGLAAATHARTAAQTQADALARLNAGVSKAKGGAIADAIPDLVEALRLFRATVGDDHLRTSDAYHHLGAALLSRFDHAKARPLLEKALAIRAAANHPAAAESAAALATAHTLAGDYKAAADHWRTAWKSRSDHAGPDSAATLATLYNYARASYSAGRPAEAADRFGDVLRGDPARLREGGVDAAACRVDHGAALFKADRPADARLAFRAAVEVASAPYGPDAVPTTDALAALAGRLRNYGRLPEAEEFARLAVAGVRRRPAPAVARDGEAAAVAHYDKVRITAAVLAGVLTDAGRAAAAGVVLRDAANACRESLGTDHPLTTRATATLANHYRAAGDYAAALPLARNQYVTARNAGGVASDVRAEAAQTLGLILSEIGDRDEAEAYLRESTDLLRTRHGAGSTTAASAKMFLAVHLAQAGRHAAAVVAAEEARDETVRADGAESPAARSADFRLAKVYHLAGRYDQADELYLKVIAHWNRSRGDLCHL